MDLASLSVPGFGAGQGWTAAALAGFVGAGALALRYRCLLARAGKEHRDARDLIENLPEGIYRSTLDGTQISANKALVALNGYESEREQIAGVKDIATEWYVDPSRREEFRRILFQQGQVENFVSEIYRHKTRERIWISESARLVRHRRTGRPLFYEGSVREVTETVARLRLEDRFQKLMRQLPGVLFQMELPFSGRARMAYMSPGIERMTGYERQAFTARAGFFNSLILPADRSRYDRTVADAATTLSQWEVEFRIRARDGEEKWLRMTATPELSHSMLTWHGYVADVSVRKRQEIEIEELVYYDPLTKLPNRRMFMQRIGAMTEGNGALLFIDLDNFKSLNDTRGHDVGDAYLVQVAERLRASVGESDTVARIGGDEFVVIAGAGLPDAAHALRYAIGVANRIVAALHQPFTLGPVAHVGSASIGVVGFSGAEHGADEILKRADIAMYEAKAAGRNGVALFDPSSMTRVTERYKLIQDLRTAIVQDQFELLFQPQYDDERRLKGAEVMVRWMHPGLGPLRPEEFLPLAEQFGMNGELSRLIVGKSLAALGRWKSGGAGERLTLAVNLRVGCFTNEALLPFIRERAALCGVEPSRLTIGISQGVLTRAVDVIGERMREAKGLGIRLSVNDFGSGYASLANLRRLPFDAIRIDGKFVAEAESSEDGRAMVRTVLSMARTLRLAAVAEQVDNVRQEALLRAFGCDLFQGGLYAPPLAEDEFLAFIGGHQAGTMSAAVNELALRAG
jgi:diguanylate cyclase (GGDEF)-like protein/PAS domain S-box-containing protein